jgi:hypothetical protein
MVRCGRSSSSLVVVRVLRMKGKERTWALVLDSSIAVNGRKGGSIAVIKLSRVICVLEAWSHRIGGVISGSSLASCPIHASGNPKAPALWKWLLYRGWIHLEGTIFIFIFDIDRLFSSAVPLRALRLLQSNRIGADCTKNGKYPRTWEDGLYPPQIAATLRNIPTRRGNWKWKTMAMTMVCSLCLFEL